MNGHRQLWIRLVAGAPPLQLTPPPRTIASRAGPPIELAPRPRAARRGRGPGHDMRGTAGCSAARRAASMSGFGGADLSGGTSSELPSFDSGRARSRPTVMSRAPSVSRIAAPASSEATRRRNPCWSPDGATDCLPTRNLLLARRLPGALRGRPARPITRQKPDPERFLLARRRFGVRGPLQLELGAARCWTCSSFTLFHRRAGGRGSPSAYAR